MFQYYLYSLLGTQGIQNKRNTNHIISKQKEIQKDRDQKRKKKKTYHIISRTEGKQKNRDQKRNKEEEIRERGAASITG